MESIPGEIWFFAAGILLVCVRVLLTSRRRRWRRLARTRDWLATRRDREDLAVRYRLLELMRHGYNRRAEGIVALEEPRTVRAFCYHYETGFGKRHASRDVTAAVAEIDVDLPGLCVGHGRGADAVAPIGRYRRVTRDGLADDAGDINVYAESPVEAHREVLPVVRRALSGAGPGPGCQVRGPYVMVYEEGVASADRQLELVTLVQALAGELEGTAVGMGEGVRRTSAVG